MRGIAIHGYTFIRDIEKRRGYLLWYWLVGDLLGNVLFFINGPVIG